ncbi:MAG: hypothetical protein CVT95_07890 [Bacteroidetes bacterium HGW-Bacteroidetes-12]|nr:MAG: hypothetical protein CVT95_07890 [Bacteroidetes bacterium HGW-Bacteroidetes-12]
MKNQPLLVNSKFIANTSITATENKSLVGWLLYVCFAYYYKAIFCGLGGKILGAEWICFTNIHGISTNHWFEQLIYAPLLWYALYRIITIVFGPNNNEVLGTNVKKLKTVAFFLLTMYIYGIGIHFANTIEIYSREQLGITTGALYEQVYWVDEQFSHWVQFTFFFLLFAWIIVFDRLDRVHAGNIAVLTGLLHGLERAIGVIEGDSPYIALILGSFILIACFFRFKRHNWEFKRVWKDFFFRHGFYFGISMPLALYFYQLVFGGFVQPSSMGVEAWKVAVFAIITVFIIYWTAVFVDKFCIKK